MTLKCGACLCFSVVNFIVWVFFNQGVIILVSIGGTHRLKRQDFDFLVNQLQNKEKYSMWNSTVQIKHKHVYEI